MRKTLWLTLTLIVVTALLVGCASETDLPTAPTMTKGTITYIDDPFVDAINQDTGNTFGVYTPPGYDANRTQGYPVVYLLNGYGGDEHYFTMLFNAADVADRMLADGEIEPMILVFPSGMNAFGGSFYTNSDYAAVNASEDHITGIITQIDAAYNTDTSERGIGGHSMGAFGAISIAMDNPGMFNSISLNAGPLAFYGGLSTPTPVDDAYPGLLALLPTVLQETGYDTVLANTGGAGDVDIFRQMMYPSPERRVTSMLFAAAAAFSPTQFDQTTGAPIMVSSTIPALPTGDPLFLDLPIDPQGNVEDTTWARWLQHDPLTRLMTDPAEAGAIAPQAGVSLYMTVGSADDLGFSYAHQIFGAVYEAAFNQKPVTDQVYGPISNPAGGDIAADHTTQTFYRLRGMLKFHSDKFMAN